GPPGVDGEAGGLRGPPQQKQGGQRGATEEGERSDRPPGMGLLRHVGRPHGRLPVEMKVEISAWAAAAVSGGKRKPCRDSGGRFPKASKRRTVSSRSPRIAAAMSASVVELGMV